MTCYWLATLLELAFCRSVYRGDRRGDGSADREYGKQMDFDDDAADTLDLTVGNSPRHIWLERCGQTHRYRSDRSEVREMLHRADSDE